MEIHFFLRVIKIVSSLPNFYDSNAFSKFNTPLVKTFKILENPGIILQFSCYEHVFTGIYFCSYCLLKTSIKCSKLNVNCLVFPKAMLCKSFTSKKALPLKDDNVTKYQSNFQNKQQQK